MGSERRGLLVTIVLSLGAAAVVFALLPGAWPSPLRDGPVVSPTDLGTLAKATTAVADACERGDLGAFAEATTAAHRDRMARRLAAVDGVLDGRTLRAIGAEVLRQDWLAQPLLAGRVLGRHTVVAVARPDGEGAQVLSFLWDGRRMRFDGGVHVPQATTAVLAEVAVAAALAERRP